MPPRKEPQKRPTAARQRELQAMPTSQMTNAEKRERHPLVQLWHPQQRLVAARHVVNILGHATPEELEEGRTWFPKAFDLASSRHRPRHLDVLGGAGLIAAVSPSMDYGENIQAFKDMKKLKGADWKKLHQAHAVNETLPPSKRLLPQDVLPKLKNSPLGNATTANLVKAGHVFMGQHPDVVFPMKGAPKQHHFTHNVADPSDPSYATIDFRAHDIIANNMAPSGRMWSGRQIGLSKHLLLPYSERHLEVSQPPRYDEMARVYRNAGVAAEVTAHPELPSETQATGWVVAKRFETSVPTASGEERVKGVPRRGQAYSGYFPEVFRDRRRR